MCAKKTPAKTQPVVASSSGNKDAQKQPSKSAKNPIKKSPKPVEVKGRQPNKKKIAATDKSSVKQKPSTSSISSTSTLNSTPEAASEVQTPTIVESVPTTMKKGPKNISDGKINVSNSSEKVTDIKAQTTDQDKSSGTSKVIRTTDTGNKKNLAKTTTIKKDTKNAPDKPKKLPKLKNVIKVGKGKESKIKISNELKNLGIKLSKNNATITSAIPILAGEVKTSISEMVKTKARSSSLNSPTFVGKTCSVSDAQKVIKVDSDSNSGCKTVATKEPKKIDESSSGTKEQKISKLEETKSIVKDQKEKFEESESIATKEVVNKAKKDDKSTDQSSESIPASVDSKPKQTKKTSVKKDTQKVVKEKPKKATKSAQGQENPEENSSKDDAEQKSLKNSEMSAKKPSEEKPTTSIDFKKSIPKDSSTKEDSKDQELSNTDRTSTPIKKKSIKKKTDECNQSNSPSPVKRKYVKKVKSDQSILNADASKNNEEKELENNTKKKQIKKGGNMKKNENKQSQETIADSNAKKSKMKAVNNESNSKTDLSIKPVEIEAEVKHVSTPTSKVETEKTEKIIPLAGNEKKTDDFPTKSKTNSDIKMESKINVKDINSMMKEKEQDKPIQEKTEIVQKKFKKKIFTERDSNSDARSDISNMTKSEILPALASKIKRKYIRKTLLQKPPVAKKTIAKKVTPPSPAKKTATPASPSKEAQSSVQTEPKKVKDVYDFSNDELFKSDEDRPFRKDLKRKSSISSDLKSTKTTTPTSDPKNKSSDGNVKKTDVKPPVEQPKDNDKKVETPTKKKCIGKNASPTKKQAKEDEDNTTNVDNITTSTSNKKSPVKSTNKKSNVNVKKTDDDPLKIDSSDIATSSSDSEDDFSDPKYLKSKKLVRRRGTRNRKPKLAPQKSARVASLNAIAKVHCLYENESRSALETNLFLAEQMAAQKKKIIFHSSSDDSDDEDDEEETKSKTDIKKEPVTEPKR